MFVRNIKEFKKKTNKKKIICLDCGKKKVGIAISDENHKISMPMETLVRDLEFYKNIDFVITGPGMELGSEKARNTFKEISKNMNHIFYGNQISYHF